MEVCVLIVADFDFYFTFLMNGCLRNFSINEYCMCVVRTFYCTRYFLLQLIFCIILMIFFFFFFFFCNPCEFADCFLCSNSFIIIKHRAQGKDLKKNKQTNKNKKKRKKLRRKLL